MDKGLTGLKGFGEGDPKPETPAAKIAKSPYKKHMMKMGHYYGENRPSEKEWNKENAKSKALGKKMAGISKPKYKGNLEGGRPWRRKGWNEDTRDSFMKELDQHKIDRMEYR